MNQSAIKNKVNFRLKLHLTHENLSNCIVRKDSVWLLHIMNEDHSHHEENTNLTSGTSELPSYPNSHKSFSSPTPASRTSKYGISVTLPKPEKFAKLTKSEKFAKYKSNHPNFTPNHSNHTKNSKNLQNEEWLRKKYRVVLRKSRKMPKKPKKMT